MKPSGSRGPAATVDALSHRFAARFPIVGMGASAGGLEAVTELLHHLPPDTGMGFVLVQHLDPDHPSALAQLLSKATSLPVHVVTGNVQVEPNHVYVIAPNTNLGMARGVLQLQSRQTARGAIRSIDSFFEALAQDQHDLSIGVILSGTASDGTLGLEAIKAEGGITFAQDESAKYDSMPRSAIGAGCVDFVLSPAKIAAELARIARHPLVMAARSEPVPARSELRQTGPPDGALRDDVAWNKILALVQNHFRVDFSLYKASTIQRRIARRMVLNKLSSLDEYEQFLRGQPTELGALFSDVLISVTSFFRNPESFEFLKRKVFPRILPEPRDEPLRVWVAGCSTGQEVYSLAMALTEFFDATPRAPKLQIFGSDLNEPLLAKARAGLYSKSLMQDVSPERLRRFFVEEEGSFRVSKPLRDTIVFARHNVLSDPPFSRMNLISCRNLLIYLDSSTQKKVLPAFHYSLNPNGALFLGASETIGVFAELFEPADRKHKIYFKKLGPTPDLNLHRAPRHAEAENQRAVAKMPETSDEFRVELKAQREADRVTRNRYSPPSVLVDSGFHVLEFRGQAGQYLEPPAGQATFNVLKMARGGLILPLRAALNKARKEYKVVRKENVRLNHGRESRVVNFEVVPLKNLKERCYLIFFEDSNQGGSAPGIDPGSGREQSRDLARPHGPKGRVPDPSRRLLELESELAEVRDYLQSVQDQHDAANEEVQASNEEVTSANEELQSINEELESSKEELESANEELTTVNEEMANRNSELNRLNSDLVNLQSSTHLAIVLLGRDLTIRRFSTEAEKQFNLLATDVGRPISHVRHNLDFPESRPSEPSSASPNAGSGQPLESFITEVIDTVSERQCEVQDKIGRWYSLRVRPYLTLDNRVDGAVMVLVSIDDLKQKERQFTEAREFAERTVETMRESLLVLDRELCVESANRSFYDTFQTVPAETIGRSLFDLGNRQWDVPPLRILFEELRSRNTPFEDFQIEHDFLRIGRRTMLLNARGIHTASGKIQRILLGIADLTDDQRREQELQRSRIADAIIRTARDPIVILDPELRICSVSDAFCDAFKLSPAEAEGRSILDLHNGQWKIPRLRELLQEILTRNSFFNDFETRVEIESAGCRTFLLSARALKDHGDRILLDIRDITERKRADEALRLAQAQLAGRAGQLEQAVAARTAELMSSNKQLEAFVYTIAHDLRAPLRAMQGFSSILLEEAAAELSPTALDFANRINRSAQFMDSLLVDLLTFSRLGQQRLDLVSVHLEAVVNGVLARLEKEIQESKAKVETFPPWPAVLAHEPMLAQAVFNLMSNALKFARDGMPPHIRLLPEEQPECVRVWVEDNGIGIAPEHQEQVFRPFIRLNGESYGGTGIGLAIVQRVVERMGGRVGVESTPGQGSRFWLEFPKVSESAELV